MNNNKQNKQSCPSCEMQMGIKFCSNCGEKRLDNNSRSIKHIISDYVENITSFDNKIWRTIFLLLTKPGIYDYNYHQGRRIHYLKPISLFLIINFLFVIFSPISDFNVTLIDQLKLQPYSQWALEFYKEYFLPNSGLEHKIYEIKYNQSVEILSRSTIIIQALLFFIFACLVNYRKDYYTADHLVFSLNLHSWYMAWIVILMISIKTLIFILNLFNFNINYGYWYFKLLPIGLFFYFLISIKNLYQWNWMNTIIRAILLFMLLRICHQIYRFIQYLLVNSMI